MTLYLKYRPKNLDELDLTDVASSLKKIVESGSIPHAFLFSGPKGTGKTSAARILAKILNCENLKGAMPCEKCDECESISNGNNLDVVEMDAASHRGIDDVRMLRDAVKLSPVKAKKKIYIIDEAHMLTTEASNALLKTLEEPPSHVVFILATTNPEKLLDTIRSRTTLVAFKKGGEEELVRSLKRVAEGEKIKVTDEALKVIAKSAGGAFRDAIKIFEQLLSEGMDLTTESLEESLHKRKSFDLEGFISLLLVRDARSLVSEVGKITDKGVPVNVFLESLLGELRNKLLIKVGVIEGKQLDLPTQSLIRLIELLSDALILSSSYPVAELPLEIAIVKWCEGGGDGSGVKIADKPSPTQKVVVAKEVIKVAADSVITSEVVVVAPAPSMLSMSETGLEVNGEVWKNILALVKPINASVEALLRAAKPVSYDGKVLTLGVYYKFHKERLEDSQHRRVLEDVVGQVLNAPTKIVCTLTEPQPRKIVEEAKVEPVLTEGKDRDIIKVAEEIFGN